MRDKYLGINGQRIRIYFSFMCPSLLCQISKIFKDSNSLSAACQALGVLLDVEWGEETRLYRLLFASSKDRKIEPFGVRKFLILPIAA